MNYILVLLVGVTGLRVHLWKSWDVPVSRRNRLIMRVAVKRTETHLELPMFMPQKISQGTSWKCTSYCHSGRKADTSCLSASVPTVSIQINPFFPRSAALTTFNAMLTRWESNTLHLKDPNLSCFTDMILMRWWDKMTAKQEETVPQTQSRKRSRMMGG